MRANSSGIGDILAPALWQRLVLWLIPVALLLTTRPFRGIYHDAHLYSVQALRRLNDEYLNNDIFFRYGNQDDFSVFTRVYAPLIDAIGLNAANILLYAIGLACWFAALAYLVCCLFETRRARLLAFFGALALTPGYGIGILSYGEGFVTPRVFAEALGVASLCTALQRRWWLTAALLLMATVLHPLMGLALLAVIIWLLIENIPRYLVLSALGLLVLAGLGLTGLAPFSWVWEQMETEWFALVRRHDPIVLLSNWGTNGFANTFLKLLILIIILKKDSDPRKRLAQAALVVTALFLALSFVFADLLGNRLFIGLQLWRVLFLFALLANVMAFHAVQCVPQGRGRLVLVLALVVNLLEMAFIMTPLFSGLLGVIAGVVLWVEDRKGPILALKNRLMSSVPVFLLLLAFATALVQILISAPPEHIELWLKMSLCVGTVILILKGRAVTAIAGGFAAVALILGLITVDVRSDWTRFTETAHPPPEELSSLLEGKTVFWDRGLQVMWFSLRRPHFYSCRQKGGMVFYRDQAVEIIRRGMILSALNSDEFPADQTSQCPQKQDKYAILPSGKTAFERVCAALPELDLIVLRSRLPGLYRAVWVAPVMVGVPLADGTLKQAQTPFFFYQCADFRS